LTQWNDEIYKTVCRVAFDTLTPERFSIAKLLYESNKPLSKMDMGKLLGWSDEKIHKHATEMQYATIIKRDDDLNYILNPYIRQVLKNACTALLSHKPYRSVAISTDNNYNCITHYTVKRIIKSDEEMATDLLNYSEESEPNESKKGYVRDWV